MTFDPYPAAHELVARRQAGKAGERLAESIRPNNLEQALAVQAAVTERWCDLMDDSVGAWKASLPAIAGAEHLDKVILAPIFTRSIESIPPVSLWPAIAKEGAGQVARIEPELAFFISRDLPPRGQAYSPDEVKAAVGRVHLALELIGCRYQNPKECEFPEMLADSLVNQGLFVGPEVDRELAFNAPNMLFNIVENSQKRSIEGAHPTGDPAGPLYWLAEFLRSRGQGLIAGQCVITGSYAGVLEVGLNQAISITYQLPDGGKLGSLKLGTIDTEFRAKL